MRNLIALLAATTLAGCVNMAPKHERPALPTAPAYPAEFAGDVTLGQRATEVNWQDFFADPQLEVLIAQAIERNRDLAVAIAQIEEARGLYRIQDADRIAIGRVGPGPGQRGAARPRRIGTRAHSRQPVGVLNAVQPARFLDLRNCDGEVAVTLDCLRDQHF